MSEIIEVNKKDYDNLIARLEKVVYWLHAVANTTSVDPLFKGIWIGMATNEVNRLVIELKDIKDVEGIPTT